MTERPDFVYLRPALAPSTQARRSRTRFNNKWDDVLNRRAVQGLNASPSPTISASEAGQWNALYGLYTLLGLNRPMPLPVAPTTPPPLTECGGPGSA